MLPRRLFSQKPSKGPAQQRKAKRFHPEVTTCFKPICSGVRDLASQWSALSIKVLGGILLLGGKKETYSERSKVPVILAECFFFFFSLPIHCLENLGWESTDFLDYRAQGTRALLRFSWWVPRKLSTHHESSSVTCIKEHRIRGCFRPVH